LDQRTIVRMTDSSNIAARTLTVKTIHAIAKYCSKLEWLNIARFKGVDVVSFTNMLRAIGPTLRQLCLCLMTFPTCGSEHINALSKYAFQLKWLDLRKSLLQDNETEAALVQFLGLRGSKLEALLLAFGTRKIAEAIATFCKQLKILDINCKGDALEGSVLNIAQQCQQLQALSILELSVENPNILEDILLLLKNVRFFRFYGVGFSEDSFCQVVAMYPRVQFDIHIFRDTFSREVVGGGGPAKWRLPWMLVWYNKLEPVFATDSTNHPIYKPLF